MIVEPDPLGERVPAPKAGSAGGSPSVRIGRPRVPRPAAFVDALPGIAGPGSRGEILAVCRVAERLAGMEAPRPVVDAGRYLRALCAELDGHHGERWAGPAIRCVAVPALLSAAATLLVGVIVEQLVANALKRGFASRGGHGHITVDCTCRGKDWLVTVMDDGVPLCPGRRHREADMLFVRLLALQLDGTLSAQSAACGTTWALRFATPAITQAAPST